MGRTVAAPAITPKLDKAKPVLSLQELSVDIQTDDGPIPILSDINLNLMAGETLGLVGESGSGKSMTALAIMGLLPQAGMITQGRIMLSGQNIASLNNDQLNTLRGQQMAMVFQEPMTALNPVFTVGDQIAEVYRFKAGLDKTQAKSKAIAMMKRVGINDADHRAASYPHQLSGGMRQRIMIAMAMALEPALLICDEPTTALDVMVQAQILDLILELQQLSGTAVLFITHDLNVISEVADRLAVIYAGRIIEEAPSQAFFKAPGHPYSQALMQSLPGARPADPATKQALSVIPGRVPSPGDVISGCRFHPRCLDCFDRCRSERPPLMPSDNHQGHLACWLAKGDQQ